MSKNSVMEQKNGHIRWIDGVRGIGCLCIFFHHFLLKYYPATFFGRDAESRIVWALDTKLADLPFFFLINGNFWVCVYLFIAGMVAVHKNVDRAEGEKGIYFLKSFIKRYLLLILPIFIAEMAVLLGNIRFPDKIIPDIGSPVSWLHYLKSVFWSVLFTCDRSVLGALWTMQSIFLGGILILLIRLVFRKKMAQIIVLSVCVPFFLKMQGDYWYFAVVMAGGIFWLLQSYLEKLPGRILFGWILFIAGCFLAAYPSGVAAKGLYGILPESHFGPFIYHFIGAVLFIGGINCLSILQKLFCTKMAGWLGSISYPFYVFHGVSIKLSNLVFAYLAAKMQSYFLMVGLTAIASLAVCLLLSGLYAGCVSPIWRGLLRKLD